VKLQLIQSCLLIIALTGSTRTAAAQTTDAQQYVISTVVGGVVEGATPVPGVSVSLGTVWAVTTDSSGNVFLTSSDLNPVFRLDTGGGLVRIAGNGRSGYSGDGGPATSAQLHSPRRRGRRLRECVHRGLWQRPHSQDFARWNHRHGGG